MIPRTLKISGFLSYREETEIDFTALHVACISGPNGSGKSALLDAMTWALFGEARKSDESVINDAAGTRQAIVEFEFEYENAVYRIIRSRERGKTSAVEFQLQDDASDGWRVLTERSVRQTDKRICQTLHLDYKTFINVSFFLQGKADQFTRQNASERKNVLSSILNLDVWEIYLQRTIEERKERSNRLTLVDSQLADIEWELATEEDSRARLQDLAEKLTAAEAQRKLRQDALENARQMKVLYSAQEQRVADLRTRLNQAEQQLTVERDTAALRRTETEKYQALLLEKETINTNMGRLAALRSELERWNEQAPQFFALEQERSALQMQITLEKRRLQQEQQTLQKEFAKIATIRETLAARQEKEIQLRQEIEVLKPEPGAEDAIQIRLSALNDEGSEKKAERLHLKTRMDEIRKRMSNLESAIGTPCPFCGRDLDETHSEHYLAELNLEGTSLGDRHRELGVVLKTIENDKAALTHSLEQMTLASRTILQKEKERAPLVAQIESALEMLDHWASDGAPRMAQVDRILAQDEFCQTERTALATLEKKLTQLAYDPNAHEACRKAEAELKPVERQAAEMKAAEAKLEPLTRELQERTERIAAQTAEAEAYRTDLAERSEALMESARLLPDIGEATVLFEMAQHEENGLRAEKGAAEQRLAQLSEKKITRGRLTEEKLSLQRRLSGLRTLEKAFGKNGIPALLIDAALPEIQDNANEILAKLTDDRMSLELKTLREYKDKSREEKMETLDIVISDGFGSRDYEMFSGGEAFRVNFAIRLALSRMLAKRAGARLQLLVIDEGFGSQDQDGREKLIEAISAIAEDFEKILLITHLDELKDVFPSRIEVEKNANGSRATVFA